MIDTFLLLQLDEVQSERGVADVEGGGWDMSVVVPRDVTAREAAERATRIPLSARRWATAESLVCASVLLSLGCRVYLPSQVPLGLLLTAGACPAWLRVLQLYRHALALTAATLCALVFGFGLTILASSSHYVARTSMISDISLALLTFGGVGVVLWGRERFGTPATGTLVGLGMVVGSALHGHSATLNAWKGAWAVPVTVLLLAITSRRPLAGAVVLTGLSIVCVVYDARALAGALVLALLIVVWQMRRDVGRGDVSYARTGLTLGTLAVVGYYLGTAALVRGLLGAHAQARSVQQINETGSLILGGRPEIAATAALLLHRFRGYGFGVIPRSSDVLVAKRGMLAINYNPENGYVDHYMFGSGFELHSVAGDVWIRMGPAGLLLLLAVVVILVGGVARRLADRRASGFVLFLTLWSFWNLAFSPLLSAGLTLTLAIGIALLGVEGRGSEQFATREPGARRPL